MPNEEKNQDQPKKLTRAEKMARLQDFTASQPKDERTPEQIAALALEDESFAAYREKLKKDEYRPLDKMLGSGV